MRGPHAPETQVGHASEFPGIVCIPGYTWTLLAQVGGESPALEGKELRLGYHACS